MIKRLLLSNNYSPNLRPYLRTFKYSFSTKVNINLNQINKNLFTPIGYSINNISEIYGANLNILNDKINLIDNLDVSKTIRHVKHLDNYDLRCNHLPTLGSLVHLKIDDVNDYSNCFGIVLNELSLNLSSPFAFKILLPNGQVVEKFIDDIIFNLPNFINGEILKKLLSNDNITNNTIDNISESSIIHLSYILNIFLLNFLKITNFLLDKDLIRSNYLKLANINYQSSTNLNHFAKNIMNSSKSLNSLLNLKLNPLSAHSIILSCHFLIFNDPIHFRFVNGKSSVYNTLNPLNQLTNNHFLNPILLSENLENIFLQPNEIILKSYFEILKKCDLFQIFNIFKEDQNFKRLILLIRYSIIYPNIKLFKKLEILLPINNDISSNELFEFLKKIDIYDSKTNPILSSGIYGFNSNKLTDLSLLINNINELQYFFNENITHNKLPLFLQGYKPLKIAGNKDINDPKYINEEKNDFKSNNDENIHEVKESKIRNKNFSETVIKIIDKSRKKNWANTKLKNKGSIYKLTKYLAFSVEQISLTENRFNIFLPIPIQSPNENITIQDPINFQNNIKSFPKLIKFNNVLRIDQPCIKLTLDHNLINSESLTCPKIKVSLDMFKKIENIDDNWFSNRNSFHLQGSQKTMQCWISLNKLFNFLNEKEKSRIRLGYLNTFNDKKVLNSDIINNNINNNSNNNNTKVGIDFSFNNIKNSNSEKKIAINSFNDNLNILNENVLNEDDEFKNFDKQWMIKILNLVIDENLSRFCSDKSINVISRNMTKQITNSNDYRVFKKFKIFKWYANSYDTFNFQLSSNPGDITAFIGCLTFLNRSSSFYNNTDKNKGKSFYNREYLPLGLKFYSSFTNLNFMETHLNLWQLFRYLMIRSFELVSKNEEIRNKWNPNKLDKVTDEHFEKCISQSEGYIELISRLKRFEKLKKIKEYEISGGTNYEILRCIVKQIYDKKVIGYCCEFDTEVEILLNENNNSLNRKVTIGDRLLCSKIIKVDLFEDVIILK